MSKPLELVDGFKRFREHNQALLEKLVQGQSPEVLVVGCCDSRVDPALIMDCQPGDLFVVRNVANIVPPAKNNRGHYQGTCSALEFGVRGLKVKHIIVLGHARCGGINALLQGYVDKDEPWFIDEWVKIVARAKEKVERDYKDADHETRLRACEKEAILVSLDNLMTFPWIRTAVEQGELTLHGWYFDIENPSLLGYNPSNGQFEVL